MFPKHIRPTGLTALPQARQQLTQGMFIPFGVTQLNQWLVHIIIKEN